MASTPLLPTAGPRNPAAVFPTHNPTAQFSFPKQEVDVLEYWKDIDAFAESLRQSEGKPEYTFYDGRSPSFLLAFLPVLIAALPLSASVRTGPPFATGQLQPFPPRIRFSTRFRIPHDEKRSNTRSDSTDTLR